MSSCKPDVSLDAISPPVSKRRTVIPVKDKTTSRRGRWPFRSNMWPMLDNTCEVVSERRMLVNTAEVSPGSCVPRGRNGIGCFPKRKAHLARAEQLSRAAAKVYCASAPRYSFFTTTANPLTALSCSDSLQLLRTFFQSSSFTGATHRIVPNGSCGRPSGPILRNWRSVSASSIGPIAPHHGGPLRTQPPASSQPCYYLRGRYLPPSRPSLRIVGRPSDISGETLLDVISPSCFVVSSSVDV